MQYIGNVFRPPSEANSLILQVSIGCSHNKCTFCYMYRDEPFYIKPMEQIREDIDSIDEWYRSMYKRVFLADGDPLIIKTEQLLEIIDYIKEKFENLERIGIYASPRSILLKTDEELKQLKERGLDIAYLGVETGSDKVLSDIEKGATQKDMIEAGKKIKKSGIKLSAMILLGIGGMDDTQEHIKGSIEAVNGIDPDYLSFLTLVVVENTPLYDKMINKEFNPITPYQGLIEIREILNGVNLTNAIVRSNHISNYVNVKGTLPQDKEGIIASLDRVLADKERFEEESKRREYFRTL